MDFASLGEMSEIVENKGECEPAFSRDSMEKYDRLFEDDSLESKNKIDEDKAPLTSEEIDDKYQHLFDL